MPDPLTMLAIGSTIAQGIGGLLGRKDKKKAEKKKREDDKLTNMINILLGGQSGGVQSVSGDSGLANVLSTLGQVGGSAAGTLGAAQKADAVAALQAQARQDKIEAGRLDRQNRLDVANASGSSSGLPSFFTSTGGGGISQFNRQPTVVDAENAGGILNLLNAGIPRTPVGSRGIAGLRRN